MEILRVATKDGRYLNLPKSRIGEVSDLALAFRSNRFNHDYSCVLNSEGWTLSEKMLSDRTGEFREIKWGEFHPAIKFQTWAAYDAARKDKELQSRLQFLESRNELCGKFEFALQKIRAINERGGHGSRKAVREIISQNI